RARRRMRLVRLLEARDLGADPFELPLGLPQPGDVLAILEERAAGATRRLRDPVLDLGPEEARPLAVHLRRLEGQDPLDGELFIRHARAGVPGRRPCLRKTPRFLL